ncbi:hypothetical protein K435DRAFT_844326 [Dendrothele bispora CBS 962.96]|uniref:Uncharacterized protein n=1 Tax=Dendrothele bispora (strain CBS 962.96) TaxID=1314807 RepID=A0A4S8L3N6_DENBC|nr:hypothetical protein K435DRAFT_844326 [Dendrothele bispora CBS 962.96]
MEAMMKDKEAGMIHDNTPSLGCACTGAQEKYKVHKKRERGTEENKRVSMIESKNQRVKNKQGIKGSSYLKVVLGYNCKQQIVKVWVFLLKGGTVGKDKGDSSKPPRDKVIKECTEDTSMVKRLVIEAGRQESVQERTKAWVTVVE